MHTAPHLAVSISGHGFGHVAQTAPVLNLLCERMPQLRLTIRSAVPLSHLRSRIHAPFEHMGSEGDIGMVMSSAVDVLVAESRSAYQAFHADWDKRVAQEAQFLRDIGADFVLSNVGYLPLAGAQRAGIPNAALCSLNWFDIYRHYCGDDTASAQLLECYAAADAFLRIEPGLDMAYLPNLAPVAAIAAVGSSRRGELDQRLNLAADTKLVLVSMGGIASRLPIEHWPRMDGVRWLVQEDWQVGHPDAISIESLPMTFSDLLASSDVLICKPGYGSFVEAACSGIPVLYLSRDDWPETAALAGWLNRHGICREVSREALERGDLAAELHAIWKARPPSPPVAEGTAQAAAWLADRLATRT